MGSPGHARWAEAQENCIVRGRFITFEGPEGSGKSTQAKRLATGLQEAGYDVIQSREPGGTRTGEMIRDILQHDAAEENLCPETEVLLFASSRAQLAGAIINPAIEAGTWVVCDRFMDSTLAYQGYGRGFDVDKMIQINAFAVGECVPDVTFLLDIDVGTSLERMQLRSQANHHDLDRFEREDRCFHEAVRTGYLQLAKRWPDRFCILDSRTPENDVADEIWNRVEMLIQP
jgi:dTMP kinase